MAVSEDQKPKVMNIRYRNNAAYRSVHASGAYGGIVPSGEIFLGVFSERNHFPECATVEFSDAGDQGIENVQVEKGIVREMEVGVIMNLNVAKAIKQWLDEKITLIEQAAADPNAKSIQIVEAKRQL